MNLDLAHSVPNYSLTAKDSIVIDSNDWISALVFGGNPRAVFERSIRIGVAIAASAELMSETRRIIARKFSAFAADFEELITALSGRLQYVALGSVSVSVCRDANDNYLLETAIVSDSNYLISGDQDLLSLKNYRGIHLVSPVNYLSIVEGKGKVR